MTESMTSSALVSTSKAKRRDGARPGPVAHAQIAGPDLDDHVGTAVLHAELAFDFRRCCQFDDLRVRWSEDSVREDASRGRFQEVGEPVAPILFPIRAQRPELQPILRARVAPEPLQPLIPL